MISLGIRDQEIRTPMDMSRATLGQSTSRDIPILSVEIRFEHLSVSEYRVWVEMHPTLLGRYGDIPRERVSHRHDHPFIKKSLID